MLSVFGSTGFIGSNWMKKYPDISLAEERDALCSLYDQILYFRGTTTNYNVFDNNPAIDFETNLVLFINTLKNLKLNSEVNLISSWFASHPRGLYSISKLAQEQVTISYCKTMKHNYRIVRLNNIVGGDKNRSSKKNALEFIVDKLKKNEDIQIYKGNNYRNYMHVSDCCRAIKLILDKGRLNGHFEIGGIKSYKVKELVDYCHQKLNSKSNITIIDTPRFHEIVQVNSYHAPKEDLNELYYDLGFKPEYNMWQILDELCKL